MEEKAVPAAQVFDTVTAPSEVRTSVKTERPIDSAPKAVDTAPTVHATDLQETPVVSKATPAVELPRAPKRVEILKKNGVDNKNSLPSNYRTKPCIRFATQGGCKLGDKCTFLHSNNSIPFLSTVERVEEKPQQSFQAPASTVVSEAPVPVTSVKENYLPPQESKASIQQKEVSKKQSGSQRVLKTKLCQYYNTERGCKHGDKCTFLHEVSAEQVSPVVERRDGPPELVYDPIEPRHVVPTSAMFDIPPLPMTPVMPFVIGDFVVVKNRLALVGQVVQIIHEFNASYCGVSIKGEQGAINLF
jgi:hypothetical protein